MDTINFCCFCCFFWFCIQDHLEKSTKEIGASIDRYLDGLTGDELENWKQWAPQKVAYFLREVVYKNPEEYRTLESAIRHARFSGRYLDEADEHSLEKRLGITDHLHKRFVLNARKCLEDQILQVKAQDALFSEEKSERYGGSISGADDRTEFSFTNDNLIQMAEFFEEDLTGQSKRKLWTKVDKDMSSLIEENEMETFLYFSIVVYIKAKYSNVRLPKKSDKKFSQRILLPLKRWLLHYKVSAHGLTFDEFDRFFPSWLREYYREHQDGQMSKYNTIRLEEGASGSFGIGDEDAHRKAKLERNKAKKNKLAGLLGSGAIFGSGKSKSNKSNDSSSNKSKASISNVPSQATLKYDVEAGLPLTTMANNDEVEKKIKYDIEREHWTKESIEWENKLESVAKAIDKTDISTREKIWDKFDRKKIEKLDCDKSLSRLIYSLIALYIKTQDRNAKPPKFNSLTHLLNSICNDIKNMINDNSNYITKQDFQQNIAIYLKKIAKQRSQSRVAALSHSVSITDMLKGNKRKR